MLASDAYWKAILRQSAVPIVLLDATRKISLVSDRATELLQLSASLLEGQDGNKALSLSTHAYQWDAKDTLIDTRIGGNKVIFEVNNTVDNHNELLATTLTIIHVSRANGVIYELRQAQNSALVTRPDEDEIWHSLQSQMLDIMPAMIVAVSTDGRHIYQNAFAFKTLGPIAQATDGLEAWIARQYAGATYMNKKPIPTTELPIWKAAIGNESVDNFEACFANYVYMLTGKPLYDSNGRHIGGLVYSMDVTELKQEAVTKERLALAQSDVKFAQITNNMEQIVWVAKDGNVEFWNRRWYEYTGASETTSMGDAWYQYLHPDDVQNTKNNWLLLANDQDRFITQHRIRGIDGKYRTFLARAISTRDENGEVVHWLGTSTDITVLTQALEEAKSAKEQIHNIMQIAHVHYFVVDTSYQLTSVFLAGGDNGPGVYNGLTERDLLNQDVRNVLSAGVLTRLRAVLDGSVSSATDESEVKPGHYWKTQLKAMRDPATGAILGVVATAIDVTDEKLKDEQLERASTDRKVAIQNSQFKGEFLARMSHEIRTPIGGILGMVQLMRDAFHPESKERIFLSREKEAESSDYLESIKRCGDALLVIINDILDFSKIEVGKMDIEAHPFDLKLMATDLYRASLHGSHKCKTVQLELEYLVPENLIFQGDSNRIRQVLMNLLSNALKFTEEGRVICRISLSSEVFPIPENGESDGLCRVKFEVIDTGIGISQATLDKLFNPFVQADSSTARRFGGTGLGLSIAQQLVKLMSGNLELRSTPAPQPGHGSIATCIIPLELSSQKALNKLALPSAAKFTGDLLVLLVEDNKINQVIARKMLEKLGLKIVIAENGQECIDYLDAKTSRIPNIVLMDCQMPLMDGYEATIRIRRQADRQIRSLPVVAMTASAIRGDREKCLEAGMNDYISKPIDASLLARTLRKFLAPEVSTPVPMTPSSTHKRSYFESMET